MLKHPGVFKEKDPILLFAKVKIVTFFYFRSRTRFSVGGMWRGLYWSHCESNSTDRTIWWIKLVFKLSPHNEGLNNWISIIWNNFQRFKWVTLVMEKLVHRGERLKGKKMQTSKRNCHCIISRHNWVIVDFYERLVELPANQPMRGRDSSVDKKPYILVEWISYYLRTRIGSQSNNTWCK